MKGPVGQPRVKRKYRDEYKLHSSTKPTTASRAARRKAEQKAARFARSEASRGRLKDDETEAEVTTG